MVLRNQCLRRLALFPVFQTPSLRFFSLTTRTRLPESPPPVTSTSAQPFSTPFTTSPPSSPENSSEQSTTSETTPSVPKSGTAAGTILKGLGYIKGKDGPVAREDHEYPEWLWGLLDKRKDKAGASGDADAGDEYAKSKKQRRVAAKRARKLAAEDPSSLLPAVPLQHQSIDLPTGDAGVAQEARTGLRVAMRVERRKGIKERNFLGTM